MEFAEYKNTKFLIIEYKKRECIITKMDMGLLFSTAASFCIINYVVRIGNEEQ